MMVHPYAEGIESLLSAAALRAPLLKFTPARVLRKSAHSPPAKVALSQRRRSFVAAPLLLCVADDETPPGSFYRSRARLE